MLLRNQVSLCIVLFFFLAKCDGWRWWGEFERRVTQKLHNNGSVRIEILLIVGTSVGCGSLVIAKNKCKFHIAGINLESGQSRG